MTPDVKTVTPLADFSLIAEFSTGELRRFDMRPYLAYPAFRPLTNESLFMRAHVEHGTVVWTDEIDLSPDTLYIRGERLTASPQPSPRSSA
jgi:hypothetical protein